MNAIHSSQLQLGKCGTGSSPHLPGEGQSRSELSPVFTAWTSWASTRRNLCLQQEEHYQWQGKVLLFLFPLQSRDVGLCVPQQTSNQLMPWLCCSTPSVLHRTGSKLVSLSIAHHFWSGNHRSPSNFLVLSTPSSPIQILDVGFRLIQRWVFGPVHQSSDQQAPIRLGLGLLPTNSKWKDLPGMSWKTYTKSQVLSKEKLPSRFFGTKEGLVCSAGKWDSLFLIPTPHDITDVLLTQRNLLIVFP